MSFYLLVFIINLFIQKEYENHYKANAEHGKVLVRITTGQTTQFNIEEEVSVLQHTSLEAIAYQLLDCQHILGVIKQQIDKDYCRYCVLIIKLALYI